MHSFRLSNFRSLKDTGDLVLRPITVLVGANSSGKSSALRVLPLMKQSALVRSAVPLLWYGDLVDFGDVRTAKATFSGQEPIRLGLTIPLREVFSSYWSNDLPKEIEDADLVYDLWLDEGDHGRTKLHKFSIRIGSDTLDVNLGAGCSDYVVKFNGKSINSLLSSSKLQPSVRSLIPYFKAVSSTTSNSPETALPHYAAWMLGDVSESIIAFFKERLHGNTSRSRLAAIASRFRYSSQDVFRSKLLSYRSRERYWTRFADTVKSSGPDYLSGLRGLYFMAFLSIANIAFSEYMRLTFRVMSYIAPVRATGQRYYRFQELSVDQIDPQGKNLAMFLNSLSEDKLSSFSEWLGCQIGYNVKVIRSEGHVSICLSEVGASEYRNIADMGYGFSQVLPIMAQIWLTKEGGLDEWEALRNPPFICAIEQPELHLHPAYQEVLADTMANSINSLRVGPKEKARRLSFVIETHSESIVNRLGELVSDGSIDPEDVAVYVFDRDDLGVSTVKLSEFGEDGVLQNWPFGFFRSSR